VAPKLNLAEFSGYRDWAKPSGVDCYWALGAKFRVDRDHDELRGIHRPKSGTEMGDYDLRILVRIMEHLRLALRPIALFGQTSELNVILSRLMHTLDMGVIVVDSSGRRQFANRLAEE
jgi:PAS domain-containing protein